MEKDKFGEEFKHTHPEMTQDSELTEEELDTVSGGLLPAVQPPVQKNVVAPGLNTKPVQNGIIAILIGL